LKLLQEKNHESIKMSNRFEKMKSRGDFFERKLQEAKQHNSSVSEDLKIQQKNLHLEETKNSQQGKKVFALNKLVKVLNSKDTHMTDTNNYKGVINDLVKEVENLKRVISGKDKEIEKLQESNGKLKNKTVNLAKRLEVLQMNLNQNNENKEVDGEERFDDERFSLLAEMKLPPMLDYRIQDISPIISSKFKKGLFCVFYLRVI